jgi:hypothetical protein
MGSPEQKTHLRLTRRQFLSALPKGIAGAAGAMYLPWELLRFSFLQPIEPGHNPLQSYPNRDWEKV